MAHAVDGYNLKFTARTSWKAERRARGKVIDIIPVTWVHGRRGDVQEVWYRKHDELEVARQRTEPFVVALAQAKDPLAGISEFLRSFGAFSKSSRPECG